MTDRGRVRKCVRNCGGGIREEDAPGNFTLRENGDELEFLGYDSQGTQGTGHTAHRISCSPTRCVANPDQGRFVGASAPNCFSPVADSPAIGVSP